MSSEEDELAGLRSQRAERTGEPAGGWRAAQRQHRREREAASPPSHDSESRDNRLMGCGQGNDAQGEMQRNEDGPVLVDEAELFADSLRSQFPVTFGHQEAAAVRLELVHDQLQRPERKKGRNTDGPNIHESRPQPPQDSMKGMVRPPLPEMDASDNVDDANEEDLVGPQLPAAGSQADDSDEDDEDIYTLPVTHEAILGGHQKVVTALDVEHSGSRVITGSHDYHIQMYDFNGMKSDLKSFRHLEPSEGHPVMALSFSPSGDSFLVVTGAATAKIYDRNGFVLGEFVRGDMYIRDMKNTKGHVSGLTSGKWHPNDRATALTCSDDGTLRLWDTMELVQKSVVKPTLRKPGRVAVTSCTFSHDGGLIAGGLRDGSIQLWSASGKFGVSAAVGMVQPPKAQMIQKQTWTVVSRAASIMRDAHAAEADITSLCFGHDGQTLLSRAMDHTLKVWDIRKFSTPRLVLDGLTNMQSSTGCCLSPTETLAVTGLSDDGTGSGGVAFVDLERGEVVRKVAMAESVVPVLWHPKLNQILVGMGGRSTGQTSILYNPDFSERGALLCVGQAPRRRVGFDFEAPVIIHNPHALPMYREPRSKKRQREKDRGDPVKTKRPDSGMMAGVGKGGRIGATGGTLLTQYLLKHKGKMVPVEEEQDPRKAILRHSKEDFSAFTAAYKKTQPTPMFAQDDDDEEEGED